MKIDTIEVGMILKTKVDFGITFWQAVKLRIAGKGYEKLAQRLIDEFMKKELSKGDRKIHDDAISAMEQSMSPESIKASDAIFEELKKK